MIPQFAKMGMDITKEPHSFIFRNKDINIRRKKW